METKHANAIQFPENSSIYGHSGRRSLQLDGDICKLVKDIADRGSCRSVLGPRGGSIYTTAVFYLGGLWLVVYRSILLAV